MLEKSPKPYCFSETVLPAPGPRGRPGRPPLVRRPEPGPELSEPDAGAVETSAAPLRSTFALDALFREWLLELKVMGRSPRTVQWYAQKLSWYRRSGGVEELEQLTAFELKRFLAGLQERGLGDNSVHGQPRTQRVCRQHRSSTQRLPSARTPEAFRRTTSTGAWMAIQ